MWSLFHTTRWAYYKKYLHSPLLFFVVADFITLANAEHILRHNSSFAPNSYRYMLLGNIGIA